MIVDWYINYCTLIIISPSEANIDIHTAAETISFTLPPGQVYERDYGSDLHPSQGIENKAIRISSDVDVQVLVLKSESNAQFTDVYMVPNHKRANNTYFTSAHPGGQYYCTRDDDYNQFLPCDQLL